MLLYEKQNNIINVYKLNASKKALIDYRIREIKNIPENQRVLYAKQAYTDFNSRPLFEKYAEKLDEHIFPFEKADSRLSSDMTYHILLPDPIEQETKDKLMQNFYDGKYEEQKVARILYDSVRYYLLTQDKYIDARYRTYTKYLRNIIQIPESLYILQLFEQGKFDILINQGLDITKILELYKLDTFGYISEEDLINFDRYEITNNSHTKVLAKAQKDSTLINMFKRG